MSAPADTARLRALAYWDRRLYDGLSAFGAAVLLVALAVLAVATGNDVAMAGSWAAFATEAFFVVAWLAHDRQYRSAMRDVRSAEHDSA